MDNSTKNKNNYSIILMKGDQSPKHFKINQKQLKFILIIAPTIMLASLSALTIFILYFTKIKLELISEMPKVVSAYEEELEKSSAQIQQLDTQNFELKEKLIFSENTPLKTLEVIKTIAGANDQRGEQLVEVDQLVAKLDENQKLKVNFKLTNQSKKPRVTGYFHLYLAGKESLFFYQGAKVNAADLRYDEGEYFSTARFRPVSIKFSKIKETVLPSHKLIINIFSLNGDLIFSKKVTLKEIFNDK